MKTQYVREYPEKEPYDTEHMSSKQGEESSGMYFGNQRNTKYNSLYNVDFNKDYGEQR